MKNFFDMDAPLFRLLSTLYDLIILNLVTLAGCLPVVTAGASLTAMHYVLIGLVRGEEPAVLRSWLRSFRANALQATVLWLGLGLLALPCLRAVWTLDRAVQAAAGAVLLDLFLLTLYLFPLLARFHNTLWGTVRNSAALAAAYLPRTAGMGLVHGVWTWLLVMFLPRTVPIVVLFGLSLPGYLCAFLYNPVLVRLEGGTSQNV